VRLVPAVATDRLFRVEGFVKGSAIAALLEGVAAWAREQSDVEPAQLRLMLAPLLPSTPERPASGRGARGGMTNAEKCAARRANRAAERSGSPTPNDPSSTPQAHRPSGIEGDPIPDPTTPVVTPHPTPNDPSSTPRLIRLGSSSISDDCFEKTTTTGSGEAGATPRSTPENDPSLEDFAKACIDASADAETIRGLRPHERLEYRVAVDQFRESTGFEHVVLGAWPDPNVKRLTELFARPVTPEQFAEACEFLPRSTWWKDPHHRTLGLAGLSPRVVERVLSEAQEAKRSAPRARRPAPPAPPPIPLERRRADAEAARAEFEALLAEPRKASTSPASVAALVAGARGAAE
jgi:hypothetical protein